MDEGAVVVVASFHALPGREDELRELLSWMVVNTRTEPGCERYELYRAQDQAGTFHLFERYRDAEALEAHRAAPHYLEYRRSVADLIHGSVEVARLDPLDVSA